MFTFIKSHPLFSLCLAALLALLQACGAERDTPFNPSNSTTSSSSSSLGPSISGYENLFDGTEPLFTPEDTNKKLIAIRDATEMDELWSTYASNTQWNQDIVDFDEGQVLLIDRGQIGYCDKLITLNTIKVYDHTANTVKVIIKYTDTGTSSSSSSSSSYSEPNCDSGFGKINQPFRFYYIPSRKIMVFQEDIQ